MKKIALTQNKFALVDDDNYDWLNRRRWYAHHGQGDVFYAIRHTPRINGKRETVWMHRLILGLVARDEQVDHRDRNGINNQRANLRICTRSQNNQNGRKRKGSHSQYKGVYWHRRNRRWCAQIGINGRIIYLGSFHSEREAALAYNEAALKCFREFARPNILSGNICT